MKVTMDPIQKSESAGEGAAPDDATTADLQAGEEAAEAPEEKSTEGGSEDAPHDDKKPKEEFELVLAGEDTETEAPPKDASGWFRLRKESEAARAEAAALKRELEALKQPAGAKDPGPEPTGEDPDILFDEAKLKARYNKWREDTAAFQSHKAKQAEQEEAQKQAVRALEESYRTKKAALAGRVEGYDEAEKAVIAMLSPAHQDVLLKNADDPAKVVYALGRRPGKLEEFAKETDRDRLVAKIVKLEGSMSERSKKSQTPAPEKSPRGSGSPGSGDRELDAAYAKAEKTNDLSEVNRILRNRKNAKK